MADLDLPNDWSSPAGAPQALTKQHLMEDFIDDFDDDDDAFFAQTGTATAQNNGESASNNKKSFGMLALSYESPRLTATNNTSVSDEEESSDLREIEVHLSHLRNINSSYGSVANSCLVINQSLYNGGSSSTSQNTQSTIVHNKRFEKYTQRVIEALSACLSHNCSAAKIVAAKTLGLFLRSSLAKCEFDPRLLSEIIEDRIQDDCLGAAYMLVNTALEGEDGVASAALESLGLFTLDAQSDSLAAEVYALAENGDPNSFIYKQNSFTPTAAMKEIQFKVYNNVIFPRMSKLLQRLSLFEQHHLVKVIPVMTAVFESALTEGSETIPARRAMTTTKMSHGKRGWFETDAVTLVRDYTNILLDCFNKKALTRAAAVACIRLANVCPLADWRGKVSQNVVSSLIGTLNEETTLIPSEKYEEEKIDSTLSSAKMPIESIGGSVALLLVALRGVPINERAAGLISALRAIMLFLPMGVSIPIATDGSRRIDVPLSVVKGENAAHHLGRVGLMTEIALLIMVDGNSNVEKLKTDELAEQTLVSEDNVGKEKILGERAILMNHILQSHHLSSIWDTQQKKNSRVFRPLDEWVWVCCSSLLQIGQRNEHIFSKDFSYLIEWSNIALVLLDNFGKFVCRPLTPSPFSHAAHASYMDLMTSLMKKSGLVPSAALSIRDNMLPSAFLADWDVNIATTASVASSRFNLSVVGGPGRQMPHVSSALSKVCQNMLILWSKARTAFPFTEERLGAQSSGNIVLAAILVDGWLGQCVINHDTKKSNENQLEVASSLLALIQTEMNSLLGSHGTATASRSLLTSLKEDDPSSYFNGTVHLFRVCMASLEAVAKMSVIMWTIESRKLTDVEVFEDKIGPLAVSILHSFIETTKEALDASANAGRDVMILSLYEQVSIDANDTIARIVESSPANAKRHSHHDDIVVQFQPSPFLSSREGSKGRLSLEYMLRIPLTGYLVSRQEKKASFNDLSFIRELSPSLISRLQPMHQSSFFLYHHARLVLSRLVTNALTAASLAFPSTTVGPPRNVHQTNPYRLSGSFQNSMIEIYRRPQDLPVMIPMRTNEEPVVLTGCSDPISLTMSYETRRVRQGDLTEAASLVVTMRLYNITPVPIRKNGIKLDLRTSNETDSSSNEVATEVYKDEIKGGDFVTWETCFNSFKAGNISLYASITFRDMEQESITRKWASLDDGVGVNAFIQDDDDEMTEDITITCLPVIISAAVMLQPCPLVFFGSKQRLISNGLGDEISFRYFWGSMRYECSKSVVFQGTGALKFDDKLGCIVLDAYDSNQSSKGCSFITPDGVRVMCLLEIKGNDSHLLRIRCELMPLLESLVGKVDDLLLFLFGNANAAMLGSTGVTRPKMEHDFASMTIPHYQLEHDFASMTMPHHQLDVSQ
ncbi:hypothetical protein ACHAXN_012144 [Cyclotella atomus]